MKKSKFIKRDALSSEIDDDPMTGIANIFDVAMVFALALMLMLIVNYNLPELMQPNSNVTIVKNPGAPDMEIIIKKGETVEIKKLTNETLGGEGEKLGTAYMLKSGEVIYVPENETKK